MYLKFYNLTDYPFLLNPDSHYLFACNNRKDFLLRMLESAAHGTEILLVLGERGTGKTTLLNAFAELLPESAVAAKIQCPRTLKQFKQAFADAIQRKESLDRESDLIHHFREYLLALKRNRQQLVLIIDDADKSDASILQFLADLILWPAKELGNCTLVMAGASENAFSASLNSCRASCKIDRIFLTNLTPEETEYYINYRLYLAGWYSSKQTIFTKEALQKIYEYSAGNPRKINIICNNALVFGALLKQKPIGAELIAKVRSDEVCRKELKLLVAKREKNRQESVHLRSAGEQTGSDGPDCFSEVSAPADFAAQMSTSPVPGEWTLPEPEVTTTRVQEKEKGLSFPFQPLIENDLWQSVETLLKHLRAGMKVVAMTSPSPGQGVTTLSLHLAHVVSQLPLLDFDTHRKVRVLVIRLQGGQQPFNQLPRECSGLNGILYQHKSLEECTLPLSNGVEFLPLDASDAAEFKPASIPEFARLLGRLRESFDFVLIDLPSVKSSGVSSLLAGEADGTILVVAAGQVTSKEIEEAKEKLEHAGANLLGGILNRKKAFLPEWLQRWL